MRYALTDQEWASIKPMLPNKPRGVPRVNDRRILNGIFWVLRSGAPWRDLPASFPACSTKAPGYWGTKGPRGLGHDDGRSEAAFFAATDHGYHRCHKLLGDLKADEAANDKCLVDN